MIYFFFFFYFIFIIKMNSVILSNFFILTGDFGLGWIISVDRSYCNFTIILPHIYIYFSACVFFFFIVAEITVNYECFHCRLYCLVRHGEAANSFWWGCNTRTANTWCWGRQDLDTCTPSGVACPMLQTQASKSASQTLITVKIFCKMSNSITRGGYVSLFIDNKEYSLI